MPADVTDYWAQYRAGSITHFEALRRYFAEIRASEDEVLSVVGRMELDPELPSAVEALRCAGWQVVVTSAGCEWYIRRHFKSVGLELDVYSNPGRFEPGQGLLMEMPTGSPFWSPTLGVDKSAVVQSFLDKGCTVAFAGDGFPDVEPARLVPADLRFARADLAGVLSSENTQFREFDSWTDIAEGLLHLFPD